MSGHAKAASADLAARSPHDVEILGFTASNDEQLSKRKADVEIPGFTASNDASRQPGPASLLDGSGPASLLDIGIPGFTASNDASRQPGPASLLDGSGPASLLDIGIPGFTASNDASRQPGPASLLDTGIPGFTASNDASRQPGPASLLDTGIPGFTDNGVKERQIPRFPEKEHLGYSDCSEDTANAKEKTLNDKRPPRIWITEDIWMHYIRGNTKNREIFSSDVSIFKVRMFLKDIKRVAYVPQQVSLGPYHEGRPDLPPMKHHKGRALRRMMIRRNKRLGNDINDMDFASRARNEILKLEDKIRDIYQEPIDCDGEMLARMVCWDGCFILEVLRTLGRDPKEKNDPISGRDPNIFGRDPNEKDDLNEKNDPIFGENKVAASNLLKDILMLENQIPCIVLLELLRLEHPMDEHVEGTLLKVLVEGTYGLFKFFEEDKSALMQCDWLIKVQPVHHLLAFLHKVIVHRPSNPVKPKDQVENCIGHCLIMLQDTNKPSNDIESIPPAVELKHAGIKFLPLKGSIKEIYFDRNSATIYLPPVSITYGTEVLFRNLIAFEICRPSEGNYFASYVHLMDELIDTEEDVAVLRSVGILTTMLGSDKEVADLFNGLCNEGTVRIENFFDEVRKGVNAHYKNIFRIQFAELVREHFSSPWKALAVAAAFILLCSSLIQTIVAVMSSLSY